MVISKYSTITNENIYLDTLVGKKQQIVSLMIFNISKVKQLSMY